MNEFNGAMIILAAVIGIMLGGIYFGGLWFTLQHAVQKKGAPAIVILSFIIRTIIAGATFYFLILYHWSYLIIGLLSFLATRQVLLKKVGRPDNILYG